MATYYFDIETDVEGRERPNPLKDKIVTIQFQQIWDDSGNTKGPLTILKSWESSEKEILKEFLHLAGWNESPRRVWDFIPVGVNLWYDLLVLVSRCKKVLNVNIPLEFLVGQLPKIDLKAVLILANHGKFKGSGLDQFTSKNKTGLHASRAYQQQDWESLINYIEEETEAFLDLYKKAIRNIPTFIKKSP